MARLIFANGIAIKPAEEVVFVESLAQESGSAVVSPAEPTGPWTNVFDVLEPARGGLDRPTAGDFRRGGQKWITDAAVMNDGGRRR